MNEHFVAVVLDVVGSREHDDQRALLVGVARRAATVLVATGAARTAGPTTGDELQALHRDPAAAVRDVARLRLSLLVDPPVPRPVVLRAGLGLGLVDDPVADAAAPGQSGSAWWHARAAIDVAARRRYGWPLLRWWVEGDGDVRWLQATLVALDALASGFDDADALAALRLVDGASATEVAAELGVGGSTLSARLHGHGVYGWVRTLETLAGTA